MDKRTTLGLLVGGKDVVKLVDRVCIHQPSTTLHGSKVLFVVNMMNHGCVMVTSRTVPVGISPHPMDKIVQEQEMIGNHRIVHCTVLHWAGPPLGLRNAERIKERLVLNVDSVVTVALDIVHVQKLVTLFVEIVNKYV